MTSLNTTPALFSVDGVVGLIFILNICITLAGGLLVALARSLVRAVAGLIVCFVGVAGLYFYLNSPFVSMMQALIYVGAVAVAMSFAIMLAAPDEKLSSNRRGVVAGPMGAVTAGLIFISFTLLACGHDWQPMERTGDGSMKSIGIELLTNYSMVFELISVVLLVAILGALVIARKGRDSV